MERDARAGVLMCVVALNEREKIERVEYSR